MVKINQGLKEKKKKIYQKCGIVLPTKEIP